MSGQAYRCQMCGGEFEMMQTDAQALAECNREFGPVPKQDLAMVCDECYRKLLDNLKKEQASN